MERIRSRKLWGVLLACAMAGALGLTATPSLADQPAEAETGFSPDDDGTPQTHVTDIMQDDFDGVDTAFQFRSTAEPTTTGFYEWYDCDAGADPSMTGAACAAVATDTTPDQAPAGPGFNPGVAFTAPYDIPPTSEAGSPRDIVGVACFDHASKGGPPFDTSHCISDEESDIAVNNVASGEDGTTGIIHSLVTETGGTFTGDPVHGAGLKNGDAVTVIAFTSVGSADAIHACWETIGDPTTEPVTNADNGTGCDQNATDETPTLGGGSGCHAQAPSLANAHCWALTLDAPLANNMFGVAIVEYDDADATDGNTESGSGLCEGDEASATGPDCQLDRIWVTTTAAGEAVAPPPPPPGPAPPPPPRRRVTTGLCDRNRPGANGNEILIGTNGPDQICGFGGRDTLRGKNGPDTLRGGSGKDTLAGGRGRDNLRGGGGNDGLRGARGADTLKGGGGKDSARGGPGNDLCVAEVERSC